MKQAINSGVPPALVAAFTSTVLGPRFASQFLNKNKPETRRYKLQHRCEYQINSKFKCRIPLSTDINVNAIERVRNLREDPTYKGKWDEYIDCLPANFDDFSVNYSEEELSLLKGS